MTSDTANPSINPPLVSVCIPVYNCELYIGEAIESVLKQTHRDLELVLVNDCSTDKSVQVIQSYTDPRIRLVQNEANKGAAFTWNRCVTECRGKYIKVLCNDDIIYPDCLQQQLDVLDDPANHGIAIVCGLRDIIDDKGKRILSAKGMAGVHGRLNSGNAIRRIVRAGQNLIGESLTVMFRSEAFAATGGFDSSIPYYMDLDLYAKLLQHGDLYVIDKPIGAFRVWSSGWSTKQAKTQARQGRAIVTRLAQMKEMNVGKLDLWIGLILASVKSYLRQLLYVYLNLKRRFSRAGKST